VGKRLPLLLRLLLLLQVLRLLRLKKKTSSMSFSLTAVPTRST
jgi:hypothetical protein